VLTQMDDNGKEFVIAYASRSNNNAEAQYNSYEGDCLAAIWAIAYFRCYLYGNEFLLVTDRQPLKWLMESDKLTWKLARWALMLMEYDFKVVHKAGLVNMDADGLSRNPIPSQEDATGTRRMLRMEKIHCHDGIVLPSCVCWRCMEIPPRKLLWPR
jgi:hypothetical protein